MTRISAFVSHIPQSRLSSFESQDLLDHEHAGLLHGGTESKQSETLVSGRALTRLPSVSATCVGLAKRMHRSRRETSQKTNMSTHTHRFKFSLPDCEEQTGVFVCLCGSFLLAPPSLDWELNAAVLNSLSFICLSQKSCQYGSM